MGGRFSVFVGVVLAGTLLACANDETTLADGGALPTGGAPGSGGFGGVGGLEGGAGGIGGMGGFGGAPTVCGDGVIEGAELCDDGNDTGGDGCSSDCLVESGYLCATADAPCVLLAGDCDEPLPLALTLDGGGLGASFDGDTSAAVDDVVAAPCDGFTYGTGGDVVHELVITEPSDVEIRVAFQTSDGLVRVLTAPCDPSARAAGEVALGDGCANQTAAGGTESLTLHGVVPSTYYVVVDGHAGDEGPYQLDVRVRPTVCGNGVLDEQEECDDGNEVDDDGCSQCVEDRAYACSFEPSMCTSTCGDGIVDYEHGETCDDGGSSDGDRCDANCQLEFSVSEVEPNGSKAQAQLLSHGDVVLGSLATGDDIDIYELQLTQDAFVLLETYTTIDGDTFNGANEGGSLAPLVDCDVAVGDPDLSLFVETADVLLQPSAFLQDELDGAGFCAFIGPNRDDTLLPAGTYYVRVDGFSSAPLARYVLDVRIEVPRGPDAPCESANDVCDPQYGYYCSPTTNTCVLDCGNGVIALDEECDDGNFVDTDRCSNSCTLNADVLEVETNDMFATAQLLQAGEVARGSLDDMDLSDLFRFTLTAPSWVVVEQYTTVDGNPNNYDGDGNSELDCPLGEYLDLFVYDATGDPTDPSTALFDGLIQGDGNCGYVGPAEHGEEVFLPAGDYYIQTMDGTASDGLVVEKYLVDLQVLPPLAVGEACDAALDLCHPTEELVCGGAGTCVPEVRDRTSHQYFLVEDAGFDLQNTTLTFSPVGATYDVVATSAAGYPDAPGTGSVTSFVAMGLFDDDAITHAFSFPFFGVNYGSVHLNTNGSVTFAAADFSFFTWVARHYLFPRASFFFDDLATHMGGTVTVDEFANRLTATFHQVPVSSGGMVEVQVRLFDTGVIEMTHLGTTADRGLLGISAGDDLDAPPTATDFSAQILRAAAAGDLVINEVLADPNGFDVNCDGAMDDGDEFVEIVNIAGVPLDLTGVTVSDGTGVRHTFGAQVLGADRGIVLFGGGTPLCVGVHAVAASTGTLALEDSGDSVSLSTGDGMSFGPSSAGVSVTRNPDKFGAFVSHPGAVSAVGDRSPGVRVTGATF